MLITCDSSAKEKLVDWGAERTAGMILIPLYQDELNDLLRAEDPYQALPGLIGGWISAYNLYDQREPVTGERFFGRADVLRDLDRKLAQGAGHVGIFGLRRIGKTSLLLELQDRLRTRQNVVPVFLDLEASSETAHVAFRIGEELAKALARRSDVLSERSARRTLRLPDHWQDAAPEALITNVGDNLRNALTGGALAGTRLVLILDEAEVLLPDVAMPRPYALELFRVLRGVAQETRALTLVLAGVNATPSESPLLGNDDNPLFGLLSVQYLGPLTYEECMQMIRRVGRKMQVRWDPPALRALTDEVGAHPLLARLAASEVVTEYSGRPLRPNVQHVTSVMRDFAQRNSAIFTQMVGSLRRYYPDEFELLRLVAAGELEFATEYAAQNPAFLNHLSGYGVLTQDPLRIAMPVFGRWLQLHGA
jgi:serine/threonine-protein kinase